MSLFRLIPKEFRFRAGVRTELDRNFLRIVNILTDEHNLSEFIKKSVVENYRRKLETTELERLREEFHETARQLEELRDRIQKEIIKTSEPEHGQELNEYLEKIKCFLSHALKGTIPNDR